MLFFTNFILICFNEEPRPLPSPGHDLNTKYCTSKILTYFQDSFDGILQKLCPAINEIMVINIGNNGLIPLKFKLNIYL